MHENFTVQNAHDVREQYPHMKIIVHPECRREVVALADDSGSTKYIIDTIEAAEPGSAWAIGTEMNLIWPRILAPFKLNTSGDFVPRTKLTVGYEFQKRMKLYSLNSFKTSFGYLFKEFRYKIHASK